MKVVVCCIAKQENDYIQEWVNYHLDLGFSEIYIYDNNEIDGEKIVDVLADEKYQDKVVVIDVRGQKYVQKEVYDEFYYKYDFDWCAFIDVDEFITFNKDSKYTNIVDFINERSSFDAIHLNWMCYGDNGKIYKEKGNVIDRFPYPLNPLDFRCTYDFPENNHIKTIIKKGLKIKWDKTPHTPSGVFTIGDSDGNFLNTNAPLKTYSFNNAYIRHYITKSLEEYVIRINRQCADCSFIGYSFSKYYRMNKLTLKKLYYQKRIIEKNFVNSNLYKYNSISHTIKDYLKFKYKGTYIFKVYSRFVK